MIPRGKIQTKMKRMMRSVSAVWVPEYGPKWSQATPGERVMMSWSVLTYVHLL